MSVYGGYSEGQLVEQPAIQLCAELNCQRMSEKERHRTPRPAAPAAVVGAGERRMNAESNMNLVAEEWS